MSLTLFPAATYAVGTYTKEFIPAYAAPNRGAFKGIVCSINHTAEGAAGSTLDFNAYVSNAPANTAFYADDASIYLAP